MYDRARGKTLMEKYLVGEDLSYRKEHSTAVAEFLYRMALRISERHPELRLDPEYCGFLGYVHDIGFSIEAKNHENHTIEILLKEGVEEKVANQSIHGAHTPIGIEGMLLTCADMSVETGEPMKVEIRAERIRERVRDLDHIPRERQDEIIESVTADVPRFQRYRDLVLAMGGVRSIKDF